MWGLRLLAMLESMRPKQWTKNLLFFAALMFSGNLLNVARKAETPVLVGDPIDDAIPKTWVLGQNYPNPFNPQTTIDFVIPRSGYTTLKLFDTLGQEVKSLLEANLQTGVVYNNTVDVSLLPSGLYIYVLRSGGLVTSKKMILMK